MSAPKDNHILKEYDWTKTSPNKSVLFFLMANVERQHIQKHTFGPTQQWDLPPELLQEMFHKTDKLFTLPFLHHPTFSSFLPSPTWIPKNKQPYPSTSSSPARWSASWSGTWIYWECFGSLGRSKTIIKINMSVALRTNNDRHVYEEGEKLHSAQLVWREREKERDVYWRRARGADRKSTSCSFPTAFCLQPHS